MSIDFQCPNCQAELHAPDDHAGGSARCKHCATQVRIPAPGTLSPPPDGSSPAHTIKVACPSCKKRFPVELGELAPDKNLLVGCDHCGIEKKLAAFQKELDRQLRLAEEKERNAALGRAKYAEKLRLEKEKSEQDMKRRLEEKDRFEQRMRERPNIPRDQHGRTLVSPNQAAPRYSGIEAVSIIYRILGVLTIVCGIVSILIGMSESKLILCLSGLVAAISGVLVYGMGEVFAAFRDMAINSYLALSHRE